MAKKKVSRKEMLKGPDEFISLSAKTIMFAKEHTHQLTYVGIAIAAAIVWGHTRKPLPKPPPTNSLIT